MAGGSSRQGTQQGQGPLNPHSSMWGTIVLPTLLRRKLRPRHVQPFAPNPTAEQSGRTRTWDLLLPCALGCPSCPLVGILGGLVREVHQPVLGYLVLELTAPCPRATIQGKGTIDVPGKECWTETKPRGLGVGWGAHRRSLSPGGRSVFQGQVPPGPM